MKVGGVIVTSLQVSLTVGQGSQHTMVTDVRLLSWLALIGVVAVFTGRELQHRGISEGAGGAQGVAEVARGEDGPSPA